MPCTCASRAGSRRETRLHNLCSCAGSSSTPAATQYPLNQLLKQPKQLSDNTTNISVMTSLIESNMLQTQCVCIATDISAAPQFGTYSQQPLTGPARHSMGAVIQQCTRIAPRHLHHHEHKQPRRNTTHKSVILSSGETNMLQTHSARAIATTSRQDDLRQQIGGPISLVLHQSFGCLVLCSLKPHGSGQSTTCGILPLYPTAQLMWRDPPSTPLRLAVTVTSTYQEQAVMNFTTSRQYTEQGTNTSPTKCSPNGTPLPATRDEIGKRSISRGNMEWDLKMPATGATPPRAYTPWHKFHSAVEEPQQIPKHQQKLQIPSSPGEQSQEHVGNRTTSSRSH